LIKSREIKQNVQIACSDTPVAYHQIVREIAMQGVRAAQIIIQEPEKARVTMKYMDAVVHCNGYFSTLAKYHNEPILIDHFMFGDEFNRIQFNTVKRARAFAKYNMAFSGRRHVQAVTSM
jgi:hypothetical protein